MGPRRDEVEARAAKVRVIRDPLYGDIRIPDDVKALIDTATFQRLHRVKQLSTCDLVFPGATHSRFAHSLGAYHLSTQLLDRLRDLHPGSTYAVRVACRSTHCDTWSEFSSDAKLSTAAAAPGPPGLPGKQQQQQRSGKGGDICRPL